MIQVQGLTKRYGDRVAVEDLSFVVQPGRVTGFLGPNGAGKSTTMRLILGLDAPTRGSATVNGKPYREHAAPLGEVGGLLEAGSVHPGRSAYHHLLAIAQTGGIARSRVDAVVELVGLGQVVGRRAGRFSLGMGQRLGIATALLGDPSTGHPRRAAQWPRPRGHPLGPVPAGDLAAEGRTVFVSSIC
jgi:ABC-2 type transport system ATP-binding protein